MTLHPRLRFDLGSARYESQVCGVSVNLGSLPGVNSARIRLPSTLELKAEPGTEASLAFKTDQDWQVVIKGLVRGRSIDFASQTVIVADASADLSAYRPNKTFQAQEAMAIAQTLASDVSITVENPPPPFGLASFAAHGNRTAAEHLQHLSQLSGSLALINQRGNLQFLPLTPLVPTKALRYGRDFTAWQKQHRARPKQEWVAVGHGAAGLAQAPNALIQTKGTLPGDPKEGAGTIRQAESLLRTPIASQAANQALNTRAELEHTVGKARGLVNPDLRPGMVLQVQELPHEKLPSTWLITKVSHRWHPQRGAGTQFTAWSADTKSGLLSSLGGLF